MDDIDIKILKYLFLKNDRYIEVNNLIRYIDINQDELSDRLWMLDDSGYIITAGKNGVVVPGLTLLNGIHHVRISARGKSLLRNLVIDSII